MNKSILPALAIFIIGGANAQQVANFSLNNVVNGNPVTLDTYPSCVGLIIVFTSNVCAYDEYYRERIAKISAAHQDVPLLLVNAGQEPQESPENMKRKSKELRLNVPYLIDKDQKLMQQLGATKTPQVFLLKNNNGKFSVVFSGAIDDNPQVAEDVRHAYLEDAIDIMLTNQKIETPQVRPVGCTIRKL